MSDRKKKILVTASTFPRWEQDTEPRFILDLCKELNKYYDVTALVPAAPKAKDEENLEGVKVVRYHYCPVRKWETLCYPGAIVPRIKEKKIRILLVPLLFISLWFNLFRTLQDYDFVHAHWLIPQGMVQGFFRKPYIVTGHGGDVTSLNKGIFKILKRKCIKNAIGITAVSDVLMSEMQKLYPNKNARIISMGCNVAEFDKKYRIDNYFNQQNQRVILFVGRLAEKKGVTYLIDAMNYVDAKLVIVGTGTLEEELKVQSENINKTKAGKIEFIGAKTHEQLRIIYSSADIFCAPSITAEDGDKEGFGLVILEAMASGLPVVASRSGGIVDIITTEENGLLAEEKDIQGISRQINRLLEDTKLYRRLSDKSLETAKRYDYAELGRKYRDMIEELNG